MNLKDLFGDEDAVSPVIGVILMVAITVILAAVIGTFVLGLGSKVQNNAPSAKLAFEFTDNQGATADSLEIAHQGGEAIKAARISFKQSGAYGDDGDGSSTDTLDAAIASGSDKWSDFSGADVKAGSAVTLDGDDFVEAGTSNLLDGSTDLDSDGTTGDLDAVVLDSATIRVVWTSESGQKSSTLATWNGPDA